MERGCMRGHPATPGGQPNARAWTHCVTLVHAFVQRHWHCLEFELVPDFHERPFNA